LKQLFLFAFFCIFALRAFSQDTLKATPVDIVLRDSLAITTAKDTARRSDSVVFVVKPFTDTSYYKLYNHPFLPSVQNPLYLVISERQRPSKDGLFYIISGLVFLLGFLKLIFPRYFQNMFRLFFQPTFRQKQTREQLLQNDLPALLYNLFFLLSGGVYVALLAQYFQVTTLQFYQLFLYATVLLAVIYVGKYIFLTFSGWVFNAREAAATYIFIVYLINKIIGIVLVPFILVIAFSQSRLIAPAITVSLLLMLLLLSYRYLLSYGVVRRDIKVSWVHFSFYILAFEIAPLLLIYKVLDIYLNGTY